MSEEALQISMKKKRSKKQRRKRKIHSAILQCRIAEKSKER